MEEGHWIKVAEMYREHSDEMTKVASEFGIMSDELMDLKIKLGGKILLDSFESFQCYRCKEEKELSSFYADASRPNGHRGYCKKCDNELRTERYREEKEKEKRKPLGERHGIRIAKPEDYGNKRTS